MFPASAIMDDDDLRSVRSTTAVRGAEPVPNKPAAILKHPDLSAVLSTTMARAHARLGLLLETHRVGFASFAVRFCAAHPGCSAPDLLAAYEVHAGQLAVPTSTKAVAPKAAGGARPRVVPTAKPGVAMSSRCCAVTAKGVQCHNAVAKAHGSLCAMHARAGSGKKPAVDPVDTDMASKTTINSRTRKRTRASDAN